MREYIKVRTITQLEKVIEDFSDIDVYISPVVRNQFLLCTPEIVYNLKQKALNKNIDIREDICL